ncbi:MAG: OmpA family protein [Caulobacter sp.]
MTARRMTRQGLAALGATAALAALLGACTKTPPPVASGFKPCDDLTVEIYFEPRSAEISKDARAVLAGAAEVAEGCTIDRIDVLGLADAVGSPDANLKLSEKRAAAVTKTLNNLGLKGVRVQAAGDAGAITPTGAADPLRRRAEVVLQLSPPK